MKVLLINGSPRAGGSTFKALHTVAESLIEEGVATTFFHIGSGPIQGCTGCRHCKTGETGKCIFDDTVSRCSSLVLESDGVVIGAPVYFGGPNGSLTAFLDRVFFPINDKIGHKLGAAVTALRRAGSTATLNRLMLYFTNTMMHVVSSNYWPMLFSNRVKDSNYDIEGLTVMRNLGKNMAWLLKCIKKSGIMPPEYLKRPQSNPFSNV